MTKRILVIGATGAVGRAVVQGLCSAGVAVRALSRNAEPADLPGDVEFARGDLSAPETLNAALEGIDTAFLVWTAPAAAIPAAMERILRSARRIVFLSAPLKTPHPFFQQPNEARRIPEQIEAIIEASGAEWTFLRPGMFAANCLTWWAASIRAGQVVRWPYLSVPTAPIDERDIAAVAVHALIEDGHARRDYVLTGPHSLTQREQIETIGDVLGRRLQVEELSRDEGRRALAEMASPAVADMLLNAWAAAEGLPAYMTSTVEEITGRPAQTFWRWVEDHVQHFRP